MQSTIFCLGCWHTATIARTQNATNMGVDTVTNLSCIALVVGNGLECIRLMVRIFTMLSSAVLFLSYSHGRAEWAMLRSSTHLHWRK